MKKFFKRLFPEKSIELSIEFLPRRLSLLDIGARGGVQWPWNQLTRELLSAILVEPDPVEAEQLNRELSAEEGVVLPFALWRDERILTLNLNRSRGTSSVYKANRQFLEQFPEADRFDVLETIDISTVAIDSMADSGRIPPVDFAKLDVQGAELAILEGGRNHLAANLVGLEVEVEFAELYSGQPLFSEVETFVREQLGLGLWDLHKTYWKYGQGGHTRGPVKGRLIFGDALFLRPISGIETWLEPMSPDAAKEKVIMLVVTSLAYGYLDYATALLRQPTLIKYLHPSVHKELGRAVNSRGKGLRPFRYGNGHLYAIFDALARAFQPTHAGWACGGQGLGQRRRGPCWF